MDKETIFFAPLWPTSTGYSFRGYVSNRILQRQTRLRPRWRFERIYVDAYSRKDRNIDNKICPRTNYEPEYVFRSFSFFLCCKSANAGRYRLSYLRIEFSAFRVKIGSEFDLGLKGMPSVFRSEPPYIHPTFQFCHSILKDKVPNESSSLGSIAFLSSRHFFPSRLLFLSLLFFLCLRDFTQTTLRL